MARAIEAHPDVAALFRGGEAEVTLTWDWGGVPAKARCDYLSADRKTIVDAKTAESANPRAVSRKAFAEGWQLRAAWYLEAVALVTGVQPNRYVFVVVEKSAPHLIQVYEMTPRALAWGQQLIVAALRKFRACMRAGIWPGYGAGTCRSNCRLTPNTSLRIASRPESSTKVSRCLMGFRYGRPSASIHQPLSRSPGLRAAARHALRWSLQPGWRATGRFSRRYRGQSRLHYADLYSFDHVEFTPPYTPERCAELIDLAEKKERGLIVDSGSDEYEGEGGLQEIRDQTGDEFWAKTKARHKHALINRIRRARIHVIFCLRCEERVKISKVNGRTVVETLGWQPICEKRFLYEMQSSFRFDPERPGVPVPIKLYDIHARFFPESEMVTRDAGRRLAAWAAGGAMPMPSSEELIISTATAAAKEGRAAFRTFWRGLSKAQRDQIDDAALDRLSLIANKVEDNAEQHPAEPPRTIPCEVPAAPTIPCG